MNTLSKALLALCVALFLGSVGLTYYKTLIKQDYVAVNLLPAEEEQTEPALESVPVAPEQ